MSDVAPSLLLAIFERRLAAIEQAIEDLPEPRLFARPAPGTNSVGHLARHVAGVLGRLADDPGPGDLAHELNGPPESKASLLAALRAAANGARAAVAGTHPGAPGEGEVLKALEHLAYHAGQVVLTTKVLFAQVPLGEGRDAPD